MQGKLLVVDDIATNRIILKVLLNDACYEVIQADSGAAAIELARAEKPDLILLDLMMIDMDGVEVCEILKADPQTAAIPIIVVTAARDVSEKVRALEGGADEFLSKPLDEVTLLARVRNLLRASDTDKELALRDTTRRALGADHELNNDTPPGKISLIASSREEALKWKNRLTGLVQSELRVMTRAEALGVARPEDVPDLFIIAADMGHPGSGLRLLSDLRARGASRNSAVIIAVPEGARDSAAMALDLGANDLVTLPFEPREMALRIATQLNRKYQADRLRNSVKDGLRMAMTDPLTGLFNRRYALPHLDHILERSRSTGRSCAVMMLDLDRFKTINDRHGHATGDVVLHEVAQLLTRNLRPIDLVARIGGEEFLIALPEADLELAETAAERLRCAINDHLILLPGGKGSLTISASIGLALSEAVQDTSDVLLHRADKALYNAKSDGRNKVIIAASTAA
ncbi:response regulator [Actibacterium atlanticum]|uniref:diguanylate cyclase n=1 Tax=Actibacterium atlanticum TaxID=1461693 RepID=A0A058ZIS7_9RHOB|nr:diguanylate cyclase [Actibacterium atlanticum]KCV81524.1 response regulator [Actibacterium atlanticum]